MSASDWIALGAGVIAVLSLGLGIFTFRHQAREDKSDAEQELADQISEIQKELAKLGPAGAKDRSIDLITKSTTVNAALQGLVLRIAGLIKTHELKPDWFATVVLANACLSIGDMGGAEVWVDRAVELARREQARFSSDDPERPVAAVVLSLRMQGMFFYERCGTDDAARGGEAFGQARAEVESNRHRQGPVFTHARLIELLMGQAYYELAVGNNGHAVELIHHAGQEWQKIEVPAGRFNMCLYLATFLRNQQVLGPGDLDLPAEFLTEAAKLPPEAPMPGVVPKWAPSPAGPLPDAQTMHTIVEAARSQAPGPAGPTFPS